MEEHHMKHTVCITGTTRGIGLEFAKQYAEAGWEVLACSRHPQAPVLQELKKEYTNVSIWELDVCMEDQIKQLAKDLQDKPIDLLINNAGIYGLKEDDDDADQTLETVSIEAMEKVYRVNCIGPLLVTRSLLNNIKKSQLKTIVTITSRAGSIGDNSSGDMYAYRPSKAGVNIVMKSLAVQLKPQEIRVLLLHPGWVKTDMGGTGAEVDVQTSVSKMRQVIEKQTLNPEIDTDNLFFNRQGEILPW
jgi:NAD(P)-dependent dehydrogenase (short-subunit alcohol dehydrogenase family)